PPPPSPPTRTASMLAPTAPVSASIGHPCRATKRKSSSLVMLCEPAEGVRRSARRVLDFVGSKSSVWGNREIERRLEIQRRGAGCRRRYVGVKMHPFGIKEASRV